jgi:hypothetical protein
MRSIISYILLLTGVTFVMTACDKVGDLPHYNAGTAPVLTASTTTIAAAPADSDKVALTLNWTFPNHATDSSNIKYTVEIDTTGKNFSKASSKVVMAKTTASFTAKELNNILLGYGYAFNVPVDMDVRVISSYANNNERLASNTIKVKMTPYKVPPKVALPASNRLFIVGDATTFGWSNDAAPPAFPPAREFVKINETTWAGIFYMNGSGNYKILQTQGAWNTQFHMVNGGTALAGSFVQEDADPGFPSPTPAGWYKITLDFQTGKYSVSTVANPLPQDLWVTGDATVGGWVNNPPANQKMTRVNSSVYEITMALTPGKYYKFLSSSGNWQPQFGGNSATGGTLGANYGSGQDPDAIPTPSTAGNYKLTVNFLNNTYTVTQ